MFDGNDGVEGVPKPVGPPKDRVDAGKSLSHQVHIQLKSLQLWNLIYIYLQSLHFYICYNLQVSLLPPLNIVTCLQLYEIEAILLILKELLL